MDESVPRSWYLRRFAREAVERYPSIRRMALSITGRRRMGSPATVNSYIPGILKFSRFLGFGSPEDALMGMRSGGIDVVEELNRRGSGFIDTMLESYANKTVNTYLHGIRKWLEANGVGVDWRRVEMPTAAVTRNVDRAPTRDELRLLLAHAPKFVDRVVILVLASSGLRVGTLLSLRWGDVNFDYPDVARITVRRAVGRKFPKRGAREERNLYVTWITPEAKEALLEYRRFRESKGERITPESPLIGGPGGPLSLSGCEWRWYRLLERAGLKERSHNQYTLKIHSLRKFFRSNCVGVDPSFREHWMGHRGGYLDESYFRAEEQRHLEEYRKVIPNLSIYSTGVEEERRKRLLIDFARFQGWPEERIRRLQEVLERSKTVEEAAEEFRRLQENPNHSNDCEYRIVRGEDELLLHLNSGWILVRELNGAKFLMRRN